MEFSGEGFRVWRDEETNTIFFQGRIHLNGKDEYQPLEDLLHDTVRANPVVMKWDFRELAFINGSGLNVLYRVCIVLEQKHPRMKFVVLGNGAKAWQQSALSNFKKLMPETRLEFSD